MTGIRFRANERLNNIEFLLGLRLGILDVSFVLNQNTGSNFKSFKASNQISNKSELFLLTWTLLGFNS